MSVLDRLYDNDRLQREDIENLKRTGVALRGKMIRDGGRIRNLQDEVDHLTSQLDHLTLISEALLRMLEKKGVILRDEFRALLVEVDLEDGVHDGKLSRRVPAAAPPTPVALPCRHCRTTNDPESRFYAGCRRPLFRR
ncbi:MAG TPA: hypothetical protein VE981_00675 [Planctomycetota bacterium]|nr:hypothetical protein [Planctomycetota bacterium]